MQQITRSFVLMFNYLSRPHRVMLSSLTIVTLAIIIWRFYIYSLVLEEPKNSIWLLGDHQFRDLTLVPNESFDQINPDNSEYLMKDELEEEHHNHDKNNIYEYVISGGDTISSILIQHGIDIADVNMLTQQNPVLDNIKIDQSISWIATASGDLRRLIWYVSSYETRTYERVVNSFKETINNLTDQWCSTILTGKLDSSFVASARLAGLTNSDINTVIKALQWQLDFHKLHKGDQFSVLTSRKILNSKNIQSHLLGVRLRTGGKDYYAFRADDGKFYNCDATSLTHSFMRFPTLKQFRISSNFNPRRINPITGRITPHRGIDLAVPIGTPVLAVGDGEVIISKNDRDAGNYVTIRHGHQYMTRYMHLNKLLVKPGQKVKRGDRIALSGNTGRSNGPHLHYELWINKQAVNPLTAKLPCIENLTGSDRITYLAQVKQMLPQLQLN